MTKVISPRRLKRPPFPLTINSGALRALYDNLKDIPGLEQPVNQHIVAEGTADVAEAAAIALDAAIRRVKKPVSCLEYIMVHEMVHLRERTHNERFRTLMDQLLPQWRLHRDVLNQTPLAHETWQY